jgi:sugar O-acyltransferase (sialic acid O-acetyltransferase NeuD family)
MRRLALLGSSGHGKVVADIAQQLGWDVIEFYDDAWPNIKNNSLWPVVGNSASLLGGLAKYDGVIVTIGNCSARWEKQRLLESAGGRLATLIHPAASVSCYANIASGSVVMAGAVVNIAAYVGPAGIINTGATVDHDCKLAEAVHIAPGAHLSGNVKIGSLSWIGVGSCIKQGIVVGERVMVGAGAVVVSPIDSNQIVVGNPAKPMSKK